MIDPRVKAICDEYDIRIVPANVVPKPGETRAHHTLSLIIDRYGEEHGRFVVGTMAETENNNAHLDETSFWSVSDMVLAFRRNFPDLMQHDLDAWFRFWDGIPLGQLQFWCLDLEGITSKRRALNGMIYERAVRSFTPLSGGGEHGRT